MALLEQRLMYENDVMRANLERLHKESAQLHDDNARLQRWVNDLQSGMYINCVYCGHRYGPREGTPVAMADVLKEHIEQCPKHPISELKRRIAAAIKQTEIIDCGLSDGQLVQVMLRILKGEAPGQ